MSMICRVLAIAVTVWAIGIYASSADVGRSATGSGWDVTTITPIHPFG
jgi:hypothetical protein